MDKRVGRLEKGRGPSQEDAPSFDLEKYMCTCVCMCACVFLLPRSHSTAFQIWHCGHSGFDAQISNS